MTERGKLEEERSSYFLLLSAQCAHSIWVYVAMCKAVSSVQMLTRSLAPVHYHSYAMGDYPRATPPAPLHSTSTAQMVTSADDEADT